MRRGAARQDGGAVLRAGGGVAPHGDGHVRAPGGAGRAHVVAGRRRPPTCPQGIGIRHIRTARGGGLARAHCGRAPNPCGMCSEAAAAGPAAATPLVAPLSPLPGCSVCPGSRGRPCYRPTRYCSPCRCTCSVLWIPRGEAAGQVQQLASSPSCPSTPAQLAAPGPPAPGL